MLQMSGLTPTVCDAKQETTLRHFTKCPQIAHSQDRLEMITSEVATTGGSGVILAAVSGNDACETRRDCNDGMMMMLMQRGCVVPGKRIATHGCMVTLSYRKLTVRDVTEDDMTFIDITVILDDRHVIFCHVANSEFPV